MFHHLGNYHLAWGMIKALFDVASVNPAVNRVSIKARKWEDYYVMNGPIRPVMAANVKLFAREFQNEQACNRYICLGPCEH